MKPRKQYGYWLLGLMPLEQTSFTTGKVHKEMYSVSMAFESMEELNRWANKYKIKDRKIEPCYYENKED